MTKYRLYLWAWTIWHSRARRFFDRFAPPCSQCRETLAVYRELALEDFEPAKVHCHHAKYITESRPWWHLCCNGDGGGWRTSVCDHLEHTWRDLEPPTEYVE